MISATDFKVIVIGGGLSGLLLGNGLLNSGIEFRLFEAEHEKTERDGFQIRLGAPALLGFRGCLDENLNSQLYRKFGRSGGVVSAAPVVYDSALNVLLDLSKFPAYTKTAPITRLALRDTLSGPLKQNDKISYEKRFVRYECFAEKDAQKTMVRAFFEDGTEEVCDLLVSAEGAWSKVNSQVGLNNVTYLANHRNLSAKCSVPRTTILALRPEARRGSPIACSRDGMIFYFSAYLPEGPDTQDDEDEASIFWSLVVPEERVPEELTARGTQAEKLRFCCDMVRDWDPSFQDLLRTVGDADILSFKHHTSTEPKKGWRTEAKARGGLDSGSEHVWLIGDAVHPMTPARGMGANQALCDAAEILPRIVELAQKKNRTSSDYQVAVNRFEAAMFPRAFHWVRASGDFTNQWAVDASTLTGRVTIFLIARLLDLASWYGRALAVLGWLPKDDAPEFN